MNGHVYFFNYVEAAGKPITIQERIMCLDANTGKQVWEYKFNVFHTDIVTTRLGWTNLAGDPKTGNIYAHGTQGMFFCFDKDGKVLWSRSLSEEFGRITGYGGRVTSPTVAEDLVIICGVFIHPAAEDNAKILKYNYDATKQAIVNAVKGLPTVSEVVSKKDSVEHPFAK